MERVTQFISCEFAVRPFLISEEKKMLAQMLKWSKHPHAGVRRLASEGLRPRLPWGMKVPVLIENPNLILPILENLRQDPSESVRRSVANSLNDISKDHPEWVLELGRKWSNSSPETDALIKHGLRTLLKKGHPKALKHYELNSNQVTCNSFRLLTSKIKIGDRVAFEFEIEKKRRMPFYALDDMDIYFSCDSANYVFMCDDFSKIKSYPINWIYSKTDKLPITFENQNNFRLHGPSAKFAKSMDLKEMFTMFPKLIEIAEKNKIHLVGFGLHDNPLNLRKKFSFRGLADGRFWLVKKSYYKFDLDAQLIDDVAWTSENLIRHGNVLILNWTVPYFQRYSAGGFGSTEERKTQRKKECNYLANKFYPLVRVAEKSNWEYGTHIKIFGSDKNISLARKKIIK
jgi:3-methyladenine DNA glycosylase AlkC